MVRVKLSGQKTGIIDTGSAVFEFLSKIFHKEGVK